jgi:hypothetical protein
LAVAPHEETRGVDILTNSSGVVTTHFSGTGQEASFERLNGTVSTEARFLFQEK